MESSKMVQNLIGLRTLSKNWFRHFVAFQWNESDLCWLWCWFMRWDNLLLVKYSDLHTLSNVSTWSRFTHFLVFWLDLAIYALCRILMKCRDLRIFPGTNYRFPGTKNFSTPLGVAFLVVCFFEIMWMALKVKQFLSKWSEGKGGHSLGDGCVGATRDREGVGKPKCR